MSNNVRNLDSAFPDSHQIGMGDNPGGKHDRRLVEIVRHYSDDGRLVDQYALACQETCHKIGCKNPGAHMVLACDEHITEISEACLVEETEPAPQDQRADALSFAIRDFCADIIGGSDQEADLAARAAFGNDPMKAIELAQRHLEAALARQAGSCPTPNNWTAADPITELEDYCILMDFTREDARAVAEKAREVIAHRDSMVKLRELADYHDKRREAVPISKLRSILDTPATEGGADGK